MVGSTATGVRKTAISALVAAETISVLGSRMTYLALPWFVLATTGSPGKMSLVLFAEILPMALLGIPSGMVISRLLRFSPPLTSRVQSLPPAAAACDAGLPVAPRGGGTVLIRAAGRAGYPPTNTTPSRWVR